MIDDRPELANLCLVSCEMFVKEFQVLKLMHYWVSFSWLEKWVYFRNFSASLSIFFTNRMCLFIPQVYIFSIFFSVSTPQKEKSRTPRRWDNENVSPTHSHLRDDVAFANFHVISCEEAESGRKINEKSFDISSVQSASSLWQPSRRADCENSFTCRIHRIHTENVTRNGMQSHFYVNSH